MTYLIFVQYMKHRTQITQEWSRYGLMTNSMKYMQQMTSALSEQTLVFVSVTNTYCSPPTWKIET